MADEMLTPEQQNALREAARDIANKLSSGMSEDEVVASLVQNGWQPEEARAAVARLAQEYQAAQANARQRALAQAKRRILIGLCWLIGGIVVTVLTYNAAANNPNGGRYVVTWGAMIFGAIDVIRGLAGLAEAKR